MTKLEQVSHNARALSDEEMKELLEGPTIARLATVRRDGRPHVAPMFFLYRDGCYYFFQRKSAKKQHIVNIEHNPNVALCVDTDTSPYKAVMVEGTAEITEENVAEISLAISMKYEGEAGRERNRRYREESPLSLIKVTPTKTMHFAT
jgi:PPOX class probable F420-dependent enzyme